MKIKLVTDCAANICQKVDKEIAYVPLVITTDKREFRDDESLDVPGMMEYLKNYKGKSGTACPGIADWIDAFQGADMILGVAITSGLSGSYNSARNAVEQYQEDNPDAKVYIVDSLSAGPEMTLMVERLSEYIDQELEFETIVKEIEEYKKHSHIIFSLESLDNFVNNGRISPIIARAVSALGIRVIATGSEEGTIEPIHKARGEKKAIIQIYKCMKEYGYKGGKVRISHTFNEEGAGAVRALILKEYPDADITIQENRGLCSYYSELGGILVGFDDL